MRPDGVEPHAHQVKVLQRLVDISCIDTELDHIAKIHARPFENGFKVVQGQTDLCAHIAWMLRGAVFVHCGLPAQITCRVAPSITSAWL